MTKDKNIFYIAPARAIKLTRQQIGAVICSRTFGARIMQTNANVLAQCRANETTRTIGRGRARIAKLASRCRCGDACDQCVNVCIALVFFFER